MRISSYSWYNNNVFFLTLKRVNGVYHYVAFEYLSISRIITKIVEAVSKNRFALRLIGSNKTKSHTLINQTANQKTCNFGLGWVKVWIIPFLLSSIANIHKKDASVYKVI